MAWFVQATIFVRSMSYDRDNEVSSPPVEEIVSATGEALRAVLQRYSLLLPPSLITLGKSALGMPGKVMHWQAVRSEGGNPQAPNWPLFVVRAYRAALPREERHTWRRALPAAVAAEIMVAATDIIDEWTDDDPSPIIADYGPAQALTAANLMLVMAQQVLVWASQEGDMHALAALGALQDLLVEAAVGQHLDMLYEGLGMAEVTPDMSGEMSDKKAGALIGGAMRMGALMAGAPEQVVGLLARYGRRLGGAAQIANDLRDVTPGKAAEAHHGPKTDIRRKKRTLPIVYALREESDTPNPLQKAFVEGRLDDVDEETLRLAIVEAGGAEFARMALALYEEDAGHALAELEALRPGARDELLAMA